MKFLDNNWGWDIEKTPPFLAFRSLRRKAMEVRGESEILDLSQGEPGYGFAPSSRSRQFYAFLLVLDSVFNNISENARFNLKTEADFEAIMGKIEKTAFGYYSSEIAEILLSELDFFLEKLEDISKNQGYPKSRFDILYEIFRYSTLSGGRYPNSWGEMLVRMTIAEERTKEFGFPVSFEEIMIINGASHGVGMFFKGFGEEGIGYLKKGDSVMMISPTYAPYTQFIEDRELNLVNVSIDPETCVLDQKTFDAALYSSERIKAIVMIDPNNPSGFPYDMDILEKVAEIAEKHNSVILTDEVYMEFFEGKKSIVTIEKARKRTICLNALSKIERSTGLRFGDLYLSSEAKEFIAKEIIVPECPDFLEKYQEMRWFLFLCKSVGGSTIGVFQHISGTPGPSQIMGLTNIIFGKEERKEYVSQIVQKVSAFYDNIGIEHQNNEYYAIVDIKKIEGPETAKKPIEQVLTELAVDNGIILMPAYKFFSEEDRKKEDRRRVVRASIPNLSLEDIKKVGTVIGEFVRR